MTSKKHEKHSQDHREDKTLEPKDRPEAAVESPPPPVDELAAIQSERDDLLARLQRVSADYLNYQKRAEREIGEAREMANRHLIADLLPVLDDLERAIDSAATQETASGQVDPMLAGVKLVYEKARKLLGNYGLSAMECVGRPFDPLRHQALLQEPSDEHKTPTVLRELQRGYELKGRVIRPSSVVVSTPAGAEAEEPAVLESPPSPEKTPEGGPEDAED